MKRIILAICVLSLVSALSFAQEAEDTVKIYGKVTDFDNNPAAGAEIRVIKDSFEPMYMLNADENGEYSIDVKKGVYMAIIIVKDYKDKHLEYWAWNVPAFEDLEINARMDKLEIYAMNAFIPQGAGPVMLIYFRPMSLTRALELQKSREELEAMAVADIAPNLKNEDIEVIIGGNKVKVLRIDRIVEKADEKRGMIAYLIQTTRPAGYSEPSYLRIHVILTDSENGDKGEATYFKKREEWRR